MKLTLWHLLLAGFWTALTGRFTVSTYAWGLLLAHGALTVTLGPRATRKPRLVTALVAFFLREVFVSALRVARDVLSPRVRMRPAIVEVPLDLRRDEQITLLAILITLTPGTIALDVTPDRRVLVVHAMFAADVERVRADIKTGFERRIRELAA